MGSRFSNFHKHSMNNRQNYQSDVEREVEAHIEKYKSILISSWEELNKDKEDVGLSIYYSIVFGNTSKGTGRTRPTSSIFLDQNTDLKKQSLRFMDMLNTVITKLDDKNPKGLIEKLNQLSQSHSNAYHVKKQNYMDFQHGFMKAIKRQLSTIWTTQHNQAWVWFWGFMISIMSPKDDDYDDEHIQDEKKDNNDYISTHTHDTYNTHDTHQDVIDDHDIIDINEYFIELFNDINNSLKYLNIPDDIIQIITLFSLNLTSFYKDNRHRDIALIEIGSDLDNHNCTATRTSNKHYSWCCGTVMGKFWISNKYPLNNYIHEITIVVEDRDNKTNKDQQSLLNMHQLKRTKKHKNKNNNIEACIGFTSNCVKHHLQGLNGFGDLECGFAVRCWDKRLIHHGIKISSDTLTDYVMNYDFYGNNNDNNSDDDDDYLDNEIVLEKLKILQQRLHESMEVDDELTFKVDMNENGTSSIEILLNNVSQNKKLRFTNIPNRIALCASLWTIGIQIRIKSWFLNARKKES